MREASKIRRDKVVLAMEREPWGMVKREGNPQTRRRPKERERREASR